MQAIINNAKGIVKKLADHDYFKSFRLDPFTIDWNDEIGFDPRDLYERGTTVGYDKASPSDEEILVAEQRRK